MVQTEAEKKKSIKISSWKSMGLLDDYDKIYKRYVHTSRCNVCKTKFDYNWKCMNFDHETGLFRYILCNNCNVHDNWKKRL